jgi:hypothetical protein
MNARQILDKLLSWTDPCAMVSMALARLFPSPGPGCCCQIRTGSISPREHPMTLIRSWGSAHVDWHVAFG